MLGVAFIGLLFAKIMISGLYLNLGSLRIMSTGVALAENKKEKLTSKKKAKDSKENSNKTIEKRMQELKTKERVLKKREEELVPLKKEIDEKLSELNDLQARLTAYAKELAEREKRLNDAKVGHLVAQYTTMEPAKAAAIMEKLKNDIVVKILRHMKGKNAGKIMANMRPERSARITEILSQSD